MVARVMDCDAVCHLASDEFFEQALLLNAVDEYVLHGSYVYYGFTWVKRNTLNLPTTLLAKKLNRAILRHTMHG